MSDYIIEVDKLLALSNGELAAKVEERNFFKLTNEVLHYIKEYGDNHHIQELHEHAEKIESLQLEQFSKQSVLKDLTNNNAQPSLNVQQEDAFKERLKKMREVLEKSRVIVSNPVVQRSVDEIS